MRALNAETSAVEGPRPDAYQPKYPEESSGSRGE